MLGTRPALGGVGVGAAAVAKDKSLAVAGGRLRTLVVARRGGGVRLECSCLHIHTRTYIHTHAHTHTFTHTHTHVCVSTSTLAHALRTCGHEHLVVVRNLKAAPILSSHDHRELAVGLLLHLHVRRPGGCGGGLQGGLRPSVPRATPTLHYQSKRCAGPRTPCSTDALTTMRTRTRTRTSAGVMPGCICSPAAAYWSVAKLRICRGCVGQGEW